jgi:plastocyanin
LFVATGVLLAAMLAPGHRWGSGVASAADAAPTAADYARLQQEMARMQQELRDQRQLILQLIQMHDTLLKYVSSASGGTPPPPALTPVAPRGGGEAVAGAGEAAAGAPAGGAAAAGGGTGSISGRVRASNGELGEAYVYVDGPKVMSSHAGSVEIKQRGKQFVPAVAVVPVGTRVFFPNEDKVFHNVFSPTPGDSFDIGTVKAGEKPNPVVMLKPGHVEIFCNIHSKMRADVLVVPNGHWARVRADGSFQIAGVPVGSRRVVLWGPALKPAAQKVDVTPAGASAQFVADTAAPAAHMNKQGGAYGSYED